MIISVLNAINSFIKNNNSSNSYKLLILKKSQNNPVEVVIAIFSD